MQKSKLKTLMIYRLLNKYSDEDHPLSTTDLISMLEECEIKCERKSIYADIESLKEMGCDILTTNYPKRGFFMASRLFELPEVRLLIDAVTSAGFITPKKTQELVNKLETLVSENQAKNLCSQVYVDAQNKCDNEEIYYTIDALNDAIINKNKVKFEYKRRTIDKKNKKSYTTKIHTVSPYALIWKDDHYYLVCNNDKYDNLLNLRLDRIRKINILDEKIRDISEVSEYSGTFNISDYSSKMFNMFSGESTQVKLLCDLEIREEVMDRFGANVPLNAVDTSHFETTVNATYSEGFVSWVMQYGDKIKVLEPSTLADMVRNRAEKIYRIYQKKD